MNGVSVHCHKGEGLARICDRTGHGPFEVFRFKLFLCLQCVSA